MPTTVKSWQPSESGLSLRARFHSEQTLKKPFLLRFNFLIKFSKYRPFGPMLSISRFFRPCGCLCVCLSVCSLLRYCLNVFLPRLPEIGCPIFFEIQNPWEEVVSDLNIFVWKWSKIAAQKKVFFCADFALENMWKPRFPMD